MASVLVSLVSSSGLAFITIGQVPAPSLRLWWLLITAVLLLRGVDILLSHVAGLSRRPGVQEIRRFGIGVIASAMLWAAFPLAFFGRLNQGGRAYASIVLCGMAGGGVTVLAPSKLLSLIFCALVTLPCAFRFLLLPGSDNTFLGLLGCAFFVVMSLSSRIAHRAIMGAVRLNVELKEAQGALFESNQSLELKVQARTAALQSEMREKGRLARELASLASIDSLTGLCNRATLLTRLCDTIRLSEEAGQRLALLFVDLDKFKEVNDLMGHHTGDQVLRAVAHRLQRGLPPSVALSRWGGDEFVVAFPEIADADQAVDLASLLAACLRDPVQVGLGEVKIDATIGIALFPEHGRSADELIHAADLAMYASKQERRSKIRLFDVTLIQELTERRLLERALRDAIETDALRIVFQPIVNVADGRCAALEALARWPHPERGMVPPDEFIALAERSGEISALGRGMLMQACHQAASWTGPHPPAVSVNISVAQIESGTLPADVFAALNASGLTPGRLYLELTESVFAGDRQEIVPTLAGLREAGIRISLDDFGTGFSCLADLSRLPIDQIKIAKPFVESLDTNSTPIVKLIVVTAQTFGLEIVAEGVETRAQADSLRALGVHHMQGYVFSAPLSPEGAREWIHDRRAGTSLDESASGGEKARSTWPGETV